MFSNSAKEIGANDSTLSESDDTSESSEYNDITTPKEKMKLTPLNQVIHTQIKQTKKRKQQNTKIQKKTNKKKVGWHKCIGNGD